MYEKDYIMRMIMQMVKVLLAIFHLRQKGGYEEAFDLIDLTLQKYTGLSSKLINEFDTNNLIAFLSPGGNLNLEKCFVIGVLLKEEGDVLFDRKLKADAMKRYEKSKALLSKVKNTEYMEFLPDSDNIFDDLINKMNLTDSQNSDKSK